ncbi:MAG: hypothetical protein JWO39_3007 [Gemmatimonadetes bacterium]|nr:hypothetical protein [Gemmatimonadota bacterium]
MLAWLLSLLLAALLAWWSYRAPASGEGQRARGLAVLRTLAWIIVLALLFDAPAGPRRAVPPIAALDVSESWLRGGDSALWRRGISSARGASSELLLWGDSARTGSAPSIPRDAATRAMPLAERALAVGRPLVLITDGELDDPASLTSLPAGSRVEVLAHPAAIDAAVIALDAPRAVVANDTLEARVTVRAGELPVRGATLSLVAGSDVIATMPIDSLAGRVERTLTMHGRIQGAVRSVPLAAVVTVAGDVERRNDTLATAVQVAPAAGAVLASTSPDFDARFLIPVLRGAVALPTRAYYRVAPGMWRQDGTLAAVSEATVRAALAEAPLAIIHGDTALFGAPRAVTKGSLLLYAPSADTIGEWYPVAAPASPVAAVLSGVPWDSLAPLSVSAGVHGDWAALLAAPARSSDRRIAIAGSESGRRTVIVGTSGLWRWAFRGGVSRDAYATLWGGIFDWLTAERPDPRAALPADAIVRAGDRIRWRRGTGNDTLVRVEMHKRGEARTDTLALHFAGPGALAESGPLDAGVYETRVSGGTSLLIVNASRELLPRRANVRTGAVGGAAPFGDQPRLRDYHWIYLLLLAALCAEWLLRRHFGLR